MIYYESTFKLRETPPSDPYLIHQRLDFIIQERLKSKLPYGWRRRAHPSEANTTLVQLRSATPLSLPGEQRIELSLSAGDMLLFQLDFCYPKKRWDAGKNKRVAAELTTEQLPEALAEQCEKAGLVLQSHACAYSVVEQYKKKSSHLFSLKFDQVSVVAEVRDASLVETALVYGIGRKRVFGYGLPVDVEVM